MKAFPHLGLAGLLSIFPLGTSQSDSRILEQEMKEVAELAMRCGIREEVEWTKWDGLKFVTVNYMFNIPYKFTTIFGKYDYRQKEPYFIVEDGNMNTPPNNKIDKGDLLSVNDGRKSLYLYQCVYGEKGYIEGVGGGCQLDKGEELISPRVEDVRRLLKELKEKQYESCYVS